MFRFFRNKVDRVSSAGWKVSISLCSFAFLIHLHSRILFDIIYPYTIDSNVFKVKVQANHLGGLSIPTTKVYHHHQI